MKLTCGNSHQICTPPLVSFSAKMKYQFPGVILKTQLLISLDKVPITPVKHKFSIWIWKNTYSRL